jgi:hypothetical protein
MVRWPFNRLRPGVAHIRIVLQSPKYLYGQIISNLDLARQSQILRFVMDARKPLDFRLGFRSGIAINDFNPAGRAPGIPTAPVQNIDARVHDAEHEPPPVFDIRHANTLYGHLRHAVSPYSALNQAIPGTRSHVQRTHLSMPNTCRGIRRESACYRWCEPGIVAQSLPHADRRAQ